MDSTTSSRLISHSRHTGCPISEHYIKECVCVCVFGVYSALFQRYGSADSAHLKGKSREEKVQ